LRVFDGFVVEVEVGGFSDLLTRTVKTSPELDRAQIVSPPDFTWTTRLTDVSYRVAMKLFLMKLELTSNGNESLE
jgi:hypothetical protein